MTHFIIHARKCLLKGLTTKQNRSIPPLQYDWVYRLLDDFPHLDFSINGGVLSLKLVQELLDRRSASSRQVRGVMVGRLLTKAPWVFHYVDQFFYGLPCSTLSRYDVIMKYVEFCESMTKEGSRFIDIEKDNGYRNAILFTKWVDETVIQFICRNSWRLSVPSWFIRRSTSLLFYHYLKIILNSLSEWMDYLT